MQYANEYENPWHKGAGQPHYGPAIYRNNANLVLDYKGYKVYQIFNYGPSQALFDIVFDGACISQRCGYSKELIDKIDNGECYYTKSATTGERKR